MPHENYTHINRQLILEFFIKLSRLEYALKISGFCIGNEHQVKPDWDEFAREFSAQFSQECSNEARISVQFYIDNPPHKQVLIDDALSWVPAIPPDIGEFEKVILLVRRVRNNLFHGGKYNQQYYQETARNEELLRHGIIILEEAMRISPRISRAYDGAAV